MPRSTVIVSGALANKPLNSGNAWSRLQWVLGFERLGFDVLFVEQIDRATCVDETGAAAPFRDSANLAYFKRIADGFGLAGSAVLISDDGSEIHGMEYADLLDAAAEAALLVNIGGHLTLQPLRSRVSRAAYVDDDPGFTQFWHASGLLGNRLGGHDFYFTLGENIGRAAKLVPVGDVSWRPLRPPVVLDQWAVSRDGNRERFTTVASWRGPYGPVDHGGQSFRLKAHEFRKFLPLPQRASQTFEIALDIDPADGEDLGALEQHGWQIVEPRSQVPDPGGYRRYVQGSGGEFSAAKEIYVRTECGWFSDRTVCYLAAGKPALVQDTGFGQHFPAGEGLVPFRTFEEAISGAQRIQRDYATHAAAARALAESCFSSDIVLGYVLDQVGLAS